MNELSVTFEGVSNLYVILRRVSDDYVWNGTALVPWDDADIATYVVPLSSGGGDLYSADMPSALPVDNYIAIYYERAGATPATSDLQLTSEAFRWTGSVVTVSSGGATWTYSNETRFNLWNQATATTIQDFGDSTVLQNAGQDSDAYINLGLRAIGFTVPLTGMDSITAKRLENVSNRGTRAQLAGAQQWNVTQGQKPDDVTKAALRDQKVVDDFLAQVSKTPSMLVCDNVPSLGTSTGGISVSVKDPTQYPGTGCVRPAAITVPALASPRVW